MATVSGGVAPGYYLTPFQGRMLRTITRSLIVYIVH
jgi:hypothetical protein